MGKNAPMPGDTLLVQDVVRGLAPDERAVLRHAASGTNAQYADRIDAALLDRLRTRFPTVLHLDQSERVLRFSTPELAGLFAAALEGPAESADPPECIIDALAKGDPARALDLFRRAGGAFFIHFHGTDACQRVLNAFPRAMQQNEPALLCAATMLALKAGSVSRARHLFAQRFGADALDLQTMLGEPQRFPVELRLFRFVMTMYEDVAITDPVRNQLFEALGEVPLDDHLQRGTFYNAMLEVHVRRRELDAAGELARRARHHYAAAQAHRLGFYIDIYQAILALMRGMPRSAATHAREAREALQRTDFEAESDERVLGLVEAVIRYEEGATEPLVRFLREKFDSLAYGEMWPTLAELAIDYGGSVLSRHITLNAARMFLHRWHVQEWRSNRFRLTITLREVTLLQAANRWQEAADMLTAVQSRINRTWVEGAVDNLIRLVDPSEIGMAMAWLRHLIWAVPGRVLLRDQLDELLRNRNLTARQRMTVRLWSAHLARAHRDVSEARAALLQTFEASARLGTVLPLAEEAAMVHRLMRDRRIGGFILASAEARATLAGMETFAAPVPDGAHAAGLTRQEMRVLMLASEGGTNKSLARQLDLSEVTVKFHLSNVYRKMGCARRSEAIAVAKESGWIS